VHGEAREHSAPVEGQFTRDSAGGGQQSVLGVYLMHDHFLATSWHMTAGMRVDWVRDSEGHERETEVGTRQLIRSDLFPTENKTEFIPSLGLVWNPRYEFKLRASAQAAYRQPSLEERFQTVGHDAVIVLPNPHLRMERNTSFELGAEYIPRKTVTLSAAFFLNDVRDLASELSTAPAASADPLLHAASLDYSVRERIDLDEARVQGVDLSLKWKPSPAWSGEASLQFNETKVIRASIEPTLVGKRLANASNSTIVISGRWQISKKTVLRSTVRYLGKQFEDIQNTLPLRDAVIADFRLTYALTPRAELFYSVTNLFSTRVETSRSIAGTVFVGSPGRNEAGLRLHW
jgi:outer membrane receptor protein involved in Fe transport